MCHIEPDYRYKKDFKKAVLEGVRVRVYNPGPYPAATYGEEFVEAPAGGHQWYAQVLVEDGIVVQVVS